MVIRPNMAAVERLIASRRLDALVCSSPENFTYVAGAHITTVKTMRPRQGYAVLRKGATPVLIVCAIEESLARAESWIGDVRTYVEFRDDPVAVLASALREAGLADGRVGLDLDYLPASSFARLCASLPSLVVEDTAEAVAATDALCLTAAP